MMDKEKLRDLAINLERAIDSACEKGIRDAEDFRSYVGRPIADAKAMKIDAPVDFNTQGAWRYTFSETHLSECDEILGAFARFTSVLTGQDQDPAIQELDKRIQKLKDELFPPS